MNEKEIADLFKNELNYKDDNLDGYTSCEYFFDEESNEVAVSFGFLQELELIRYRWKVDFKDFHNSIETIKDNLDDMVSLKETDEECIRKIKQEFNEEIYKDQVEYFSEINVFEFYDEDGLFTKETFVDDFYIEHFRNDDDQIVEHGNRKFLKEHPSYQEEPVYKFFRTCEIQCESFKEKLENVFECVEMNSEKRGQSM